MLVIGAGNGRLHPSFSRDSLLLPISWYVYFPLNAANMHCQMHKGGMVVFSCSLLWMFFSFVHKKRVSYPLERFGGVVSPNQFHFCEV